MRKATIVITLISFYLNINAQNINKVFIVDVFIQLQIDNFPLNLKNELIKNRHKVDKNENVQYDMIIDSINNSILVQTNIAGNDMTSPSRNLYVKSFPINNNSCKIICSSSINSYADNRQGAIYIYQYEINTRKLEKDSTLYKLLDIHLNDFFKENTPDTVILKYKEYVEPTYSFLQDTIECSISDKGYANTLLDETWLKGNIIGICWINGDFVQCKIEKEKSDKELDSLENE